MPLDVLGELKVRQHATGSNLSMSRPQQAHASAYASCSKEIGTLYSTSRKTSIVFVALCLWPIHLCLPPHI